MRFSTRSPQSARRRGLGLLLACGSMMLAGLFGPFASLAGATSVPSSLELTSQTNWVGPSGTFGLDLEVHSPLPTSELSLKISLYTRSTSTTAFVQSLTNGGISGEVPLSTTRSITLRPQAPVTDEIERLKIAVQANTGAKASSVPSLDLSCEPSYCSGVYPVQVALVDTDNDTALTSFVTHLIYLASPEDLVPLKVGIVLPIGTRLSLNPAGQSSLSTGQLESLSSTISVLRGHRDVALSLDLYPQLLVALQRSVTGHLSGIAARDLAELRSLLLARKDHDELLRTGFVPFSLNNLSEQVQEQEIRLQFHRAAAALKGTVDATSAPQIFVPNNELSSNSIAALHALGMNDLVLQSDNASIPSFDLTETAPVVLETGTAKPNPPTAFFDNSSLSAQFESSSTNGVLDAHRLLAELAQVYFEQPADSERAVVLAPSTWQPNSEFLATLLNGLATLPTAQASTLANLFSNVPIGANDNPTSATLRTESSSSSSLSANDISRARRVSASVASVLPNDAALQQRLADAVLLGEADVSQSARAPYLNEPTRTLQDLGHSLSVLAGRAITLTARNGQFPITIRSSGARPAHVLLRLSSADLQFPAAEQTAPIVLTAKDNQHLIALSARTSGAFSLHLSLLSPRGGYVLAEGNFTVRSTAISGVAIALSIAALAVLAFWWGRSIMRHRRARRAHAPST